MDEKDKRKVYFALKGFASIFLIWALFAFGVVDFSVLQTLVSNPAIVILLVSLCLIMHLISIMRWQILLFCQSIEISNLQAATSVFLSLCLNSFLPGGGISGEAVRMAYITNKAPNRKAEAVLSVLMDRILGFYAAITIGALSGFFLLIQGYHHPVFITLALSAIVGLLGLPIGGLLLYFFVKKKWKI